MTYWQDRIRQENEDFYKMSVNAQKEALRAIYVNQSEKLQNQIIRVFLKMMDDSSTKGKIYLNDLYRTNSYHELLNYFNKCAKTIGGAQVTITQKALLDAYDFAIKTIDKFLPTHIVKPTFNVPSAVDTKQLLRQAWCADGKNFSDRIWQNKNKLAEQLMGSLSDGLMRGESPHKLSQQIMRNLEVDERAAYRIARTETAHAQISGQINRYKELGFTHGRFNATDPCDDCQALHNQLFTLSELESMIPLHPNCECSFLLEVD